MLIFGANIALNVNSYFILDFMLKVHMKTQHANFEEVYFTNGYNNLWIVKMVEHSIGFIFEEKSRISKWKNSSQFLLTNISIHQSALCQVITAAKMINTEIVVRWLCDTEWSLVERNENKKWRILKRGKFPAM